MEMEECAIDIVRAVGEVLGALKALLWKIGNVFGKIGLFIVKGTELIYERSQEEVEEDKYRLVTEGEGIEGEQEEEDE